MIICVHTRTGVKAVVRPILAKILAVESEGLVADRTWETRGGTLSDCLQASCMAELGVRWCCEQGHSSEEKAKDWAWVLLSV